MNLDFPELRPVEEYLKAQGRFRHLTPDIIARIQSRVDKEYTRLKAKEILEEIW